MALGVVWDQVHLCRPPGSLLSGYLTQREEQTLRKAGGLEKGAGNSSFSCLPDFLCVKEPDKHAGKGEGIGFCGEIVPLLPGTGVVLAAVVVAAAMVVSVAIHPPIRAVMPGLVPATIVVAAIVHVVITPVVAWQRVVVSRVMKGRTDAKPLWRWQARRQQSDERHCGRKEQDFPGMARDGWIHKHASSAGGNAGV